MLIATNLPKEKYIEFSERETGIEIPPAIKVERINFYLFSTYAPVGPLDHYGKVHLGVAGKFFPISDGQYDYPWWLTLFN